MTDGGGDARRYGTVEGVFVPTLLTILGVILYLRTGWVLGNAGLLGALAIVGATFVIVGCTALSLASISTNVAPQAGGAYALVARSFGVEAGGALGLPLYASQTLVIVLYTFGFRDGWLTIFPEHPPLGVDLGVSAALVGVVLVSTKAAFRVQYVVLAVVVASLASVAWAAFTVTDPAPLTLLGDYPGDPERGFPGTDPWTVFAVFFPAATGIMAGLNMSGELRDPRRSIMRGTLAAVACGALIYLGAVAVLARLAPTEELVRNYTVLVDRAAWSPIVLAGLLAATFSSALASLVGAPRILHALAEHRLVPWSSRLARRDGRGEPRHALAVTIAVVLTAVLLVRDLNAVAPLITLVFLLTYAAINLAVLIESAVGVTSYRPRFRVPWIVPAVGAVGCLGAMLVIDAAFTALAVLLVGGLLAWLATRPLERPHSDLRRAGLLALARWATRTAKTISGSEERDWVPRLLVPVSGEDDLMQRLAWAGRLTPPTGSIRFAALLPADGGDGLDRQVQDLVQQLRDDGLDASTLVVDVDEDEDGAVEALHTATSGDDTAINVVVRAMGSHDQNGAMEDLVTQSHERGVGVVLLPAGLPPEASDEEPPSIGLWVRGPGGRWDVGSHLPRTDLALLVAYQLVQHGDCRLTLVTAVERTEDVAPARDYLGDVIELARLPGSTQVEVLHAGFPDALGALPEVAMNILAVPPEVDLEHLHDLQTRSRVPCLFVRDSGVENAFA